VLRALDGLDGRPPSDPQLSVALATVQEDTKTDIDLVRSPERNLIRNSGQYWKGLGLLLPVDGAIQLSEFGRRVASGRITKDEFAATVIREAVLPNPWTYSAAARAPWEGNGLQIRPLVTILQVMEYLRETSAREGFLTPHELVQIVIPLAGERVRPAIMSDYILEHRKGRLSLAGWPNCAEEANDRRMAREFLLFLARFGVCKQTERQDVQEEKFHLREAIEASQLIASGPTLYSLQPEERHSAVATTADSGLALFIERSRRSIQVLDRLGQRQFRKRVIDGYSGACFLTGETILDVLEAAHVVPVEYGGTDTLNNGLCLRVDIHRLYDAGRIRILPDGELDLDPIVKDSVNYRSLPAQVPLPVFLTAEGVRWRFTYL